MDEEIREPSVSRPPPVERKFPCVQCGAMLEFSPSERALACPYCGHTETLEADDVELNERDLNEFLAKHTGEDTVSGRSFEVQCSSCGAVVLLEGKVVTDTCPYCNNHLVNKPVEAHAMVTPEGILPFAIDNRKAIDAFEKWLASRWFAPNALKQFANLGKLQGVYIPFWTFDSMTYSHYRGERGTRYITHETYTDAQGNRKTRAVTRIRWRSVRGEVQHFFDDVLICASESIPEQYTSWLTRAELGELEPFRPEFLSGFVTERYTLGPKEGFPKARQIMDEKIRELCRRDIGGDAQRVHSVSTKHIGVTFKLVLIPVWLAVYRFREQPYRVIVNGRTGQIYGDRPYSWWKIVSLSLLVLLLVGLVIWFVWR